MKSAYTFFQLNMDANAGSARPDRKTIEKKRRMHMKSLYARLNSLLPCSKKGVSLPLPELLDESVSYIKDLQKKLEQMKETKSHLAGGMGSEISTITPHLDLREVDGRVGVAIITDARDWSVFYKVVEVIEEEGGEILSANVTIVGNKAFYIIHSLVEEDNSGSETIRVSEKLRNRVKSIV
ncbi:hypothetical protein KFK09_004923 [Dendrobium nobile]|uniref:BHLH domain-containing protein n=1 Tax=Dendrobium nobile TaxID=94219 RepID=A0A8T3BZ64_DENNO|nr:hypothetical protein KFK09_004923 [Dendrobium nobile]